MRRITTSKGSRTRPVRKSPPRLKRYTDSVFTSLAKQTRYMEPALASRWQEIVGPEIAAICWPARVLSDGQHRLLEVVVKNGAVATRVNYEAPTILKAVAKVLGPGVVNRILVKQHGQRARNQPIKAAKQAAEPAPLGATETSDNASSPLAAVLKTYRNSVQKNPTKKK